MILPMPASKLPSAGVLACSVIALCLWHTATSSQDFVLKDGKQAEFAHSLDNFLIILPTRVKRTGEFLSHNLHPRAHSHFIRKRSSGIIDEEKNQSESDSTLHYNVTLDTNKLHLELKPNTKFIGRQLVVERWNSRFGNLSDVSVKKLQHQQHGCHFVGHVSGKTNSKAALAACSGLMGYFQSDGEEYFIEPVKGHDVLDGQGHPHIVYKRSAIPAHLSASPILAHPSNGVTCGVQENYDKELKMRERWERHRRSTEGTESSEEKHRRKKRSISIEKHVETLVVIDRQMVEYYDNNDIETYVLTIMNMVSSVFHDASIGNAINIVLAKIIMLEEDQDDLKITHHADKTLASFCKWQKKLNPRDEGHANHHDVAILLTRHNICSRMNVPCGTLGLAQVAGMCQPHRSCNINEDTGLALAYTVSHEMGHNFGMRHDGVHNACQSPNTGRQHVMAPHLISDSVPLVWSSCSRQSITRFLDRDWGYCLDDEPAKHDFEFPVQPPGTMYDADHQCTLQYGPSATICDGIENVCDTLWCRVDNRCLTRLEAAVEGTLCGENKWCMNGECQMIGDRPEAINGEWGVWGGWTSCTRTCGAGVSFSERHCENPPPSNGGKYCIGERKRYRICNTDDCPEDAPSFRHQQCAEFNKKKYKKRFYEWEPIPTPMTPCQLHCKPKDKYFSVLWKDVVTDGTSCTPGGRHMCISGRCRHVGCDWVLDSRAKDDRCGICHGDGSSCKTVKQQFKEKQGSGYVEATIIPVGARNIRVEEVAAANNYLALRGDRGDYYLNGNWFIQWSGDYEVAGTVIQYRRIGNKESFNASGPLTEPLHIMLLFQSDNPGLTFEYTIPNENATEARIPEFHWEFTDWSHCTVSCGGGFQRSYVVCMEMEAGHVDDRYCNQTNKLDDESRSCNKHLCPARWWVGPWQHCSVSCGDTGKHRRTVICVRSLGPDEQIALEDSACEDQDKSTSVKRCKHKEPCPVYGEWAVGEWQDTCNGNPCAFHMRTVECDSPTKGCNEKTRPDNRKQCGNITCGRWDFGTWSQCTRSCGGGMQYRNVYCDGGQSCNLETEPLAQKHCIFAPCPRKSTTPYISLPREITPLSPSTLTVTKATGDHTKLPHSHTKFSTTEYVFQTVPPDMNPTLKHLASKANHTVKENRPNGNVKNIFESVKKSVNNLGGDLKLPDSKAKHTQIGPSAVMLGGHHDLHITDVKEDFLSHVEEGGYESTNTHNLNNNNHEDNSKQKSAGFLHNIKLGVGGKDNGIIPSAIEDKTLGGIILESQETVILGGTPGHWSKGDNRNHIRGGNIGHNKGSNSHAEMAVEDSKTTVSKTTESTATSMTVTTSSTSRPTSPPVLYVWKTGEWSKCSKHCGGGIKSRNITCLESVTRLSAADRHCMEDERPVVKETCHTMACLDWRVSPWSYCSEKCGVGVKKRHVHCPEVHKCESSSKPDHIRPCEVTPCQDWVPGQWSLCTKTCGGGEQLRMVQCVDFASQQKVDRCDPDTKPPDRKKCSSDKCPTQEAALTSRCVFNKMGYKLCEALKNRGQCQRSFVQRKCCKSCGIKYFEISRQHVPKT